MRTRLVLVLCLLLPSLAATAQKPPPAQDDAQNQIRLNRPVGGGDGPSVSSGSGSGPGLITEISAAESLRLFEGTGLGTVRLVDDKEGAYLHVRFDNADSFIFHNNCTDGRCRSLLFMAFLDARRGASLNVVNSYNLKTMHTKLVRNDNGEIVLMMAHNLARGVSAENLRALAPFWMQVHRDALVAR